MEVATSNQEFRGCRNFRSSLQQLRQPLHQLFMRCEREAQLFRAEEQINIRAKFASRSKDFFFRADFRACHASHLAVSSMLEAAFIALRNSPNSGTRCASSTCARSSG